MRKVVRRDRRLAHRSALSLAPFILLVATSCSTPSAPEAVESLPDGIALHRQRIVDGATIEAYLQAWSEEKSALQRFWVRVDRNDSVCIDVRKSKRWVLENGELAIAGRGAPRPVPDREAALAGLVDTLRSEDTKWKMLDRDGSDRKFPGGERAVSLGQPQGWPAGTELVLTFAFLDDSPRRMVLFEPDGEDHKFSIKELRYDVVFSEVDFDRVQPLAPAPWPVEPLEY